MTDTKLCKNVFNPNEISNPFIQEATGCVEFYDNKLKWILGLMPETTTQLGLAPDPDIQSDTLKKCHQILWSRKLPNGQQMKLNDQLKWQNFTFGSDSMINGYIWSNSYKYKLQEFYHKEQMTFFNNMHNFTLWCYTIGNFIIFPKHISINVARSKKPVQDRFDITLDCIRKFYKNENSPLDEAFQKNRTFFDLFKDFKGYVDFFFLKGLVSKNYERINFFSAPEEPLPQNIQNYNLYRENCIAFIQDRNNQIKKYWENLDEKI